MWVEGKMEGNGTYKWNDEREYKGMFKDNMMHGKGELKQKDGLVMKGTWERGVVDSKSVLTVESGDKFFYTSRVDHPAKNSLKPIAYVSQSAR